MLARGNEAATVTVRVFRRFLFGFLIAQLVLLNLREVRIFNLFLLIHHKTIPHLSGINRKVVNIEHVLSQILPKLRSVPTTATTIVTSTILI